jgi:hypothetical protein
MTVLAICIAAVLIVVVVIAGLHRPPAEPPPVDPESMTRAAIELHRIGRKLDVAYTKVEQRRGSARLKREIRDALDSDDEG